MALRECFTHQKVTLAWHVLSFALVRYPKLPQIICSVHVNFGGVLESVVTALLLDWPNDCRLTLGCAKFIMCSSSTRHLWATRPHFQVYKIRLGDECFSFLQCQQPRKRTTHGRHRVHILESNFGINRNGGPSINLQCPHRGPLNGLSLLCTTPSETIKHAL